MAVRFLQINLHGCKAAQDLLEQTAKEERVDVIIASEQYRNLTHRWYSDASSRAAIHIPLSSLRVTNVATISANGWTWVELGGCRVYSCYFSPNSSFDEFARGIADLEENVRTSTLPVIAVSYTHLTLPTKA